jgi:hypothetical protein
MREILNRLVFRRKQGRHPVSMLMSRVAGPTASAVGALSSPRPSFRREDTRLLVESLPCKMHARATSALPPGWKGNRSAKAFARLLSLRYSELAGPGAARRRSTAGRPRSQWLALQLAAAASKAGLVAGLRRQCRTPQKARNPRKGNSWRDSFATKSTSDMRQCWDGACRWIGNRDVASD